MSQKRLSWRRIGDEDEVITFQRELVEDEISRLQRPGKRRRLETQGIESDHEVDASNEHVARGDTRIYAEDVEQPAQVAGSPTQGPGNLSAIFTKPLDSKALAKKQKDLSKSGVIYISRIPPFMTPQQLRSLLQAHAPKGLGRVFLMPESAEQRSRRRKNGGNKKRSFTDGWVEFVSKKDAKVAAELLNTRIMGGKKGNQYHDDIWNIKYLHKYKWADLMDQFNKEEKERESRLRAEVTQSRKEQKAFIAQVEQAKVMRTKELRRQQRAGGSDPQSKRENSATSGGGEVRTYGQTAVYRREDKPSSDSQSAVKTRDIIRKLI